MWEKFRAWINRPSSDDIYEWHEYFATTTVTLWDGTFARGKVMRVMTVSGRWTYRRQTNLEAQKEQQGSGS